LQVTDRVQKERPSKTTSFYSIAHKYALNGTIVVTICNRGMAKVWLQQWYVSARRAGVSNSMVVATDSETYSWIFERIGERVVHVDELVPLLDSDRWKSQRLKTGVESSAFNWRSKGYEKIVIQRASILKALLEISGLNVIYSDTDIHWLKNPSNFIVERYLDQHLCVQREMGDELGDYNCSGFMYMRFTAITLLFLQKWENYIKKRLKKQGFFTDQEELNRLLRQLSDNNSPEHKELLEFKATTFDSEEFPSGVNYFSSKVRGKGKLSNICQSKNCLKWIWKPKKNFSAKLNGKNFIVHHNFAKTNELKVKRAKSAGLWIYLEDDDWFD
jgi:hypothetical protein